MSSTNKTTNLKLNDWVGTDVPQREDFNADNQRIDKAIGDHTGNTTVHITQAERDLWGLPFYYYNYFGNGKATRKVEIPIPFRPRFAIVFADGMAPSVCKFSSSANYHYVAFASQTRGTIGMTLDDQTLTVNQSVSPVTGQEYACLNQNGTTYAVLFFR